MKIVTPRFAVHYIAGLLLLLCVSSCHYNKSHDKEIADAKRKAVEYYKLVQQSNTDAVPALFSDHFYKSTTRDHLLTMINNAKVEYGAITSYYMSASKDMYSFKRGKEDETIDLVYKVTYSSGHISKERFTFFLEDETVGKIEAFKMSKWKDGIEDDDDEL